MVKKLLAVFLLLLSACAQQHDISFTKRPCLYPMYEYDFSLCQDFYFDVDGKEFLIPEGFNTDLASIPRILWSIYSPARTETIPAAIIHDFLYFCPDDMSRAEADSIFYDTLIYKGFPKHSAYKYWLGVRIFGSGHFNANAYCTVVPIGAKNSIGQIRKGTHIELAENDEVDYE